MNSFSIGDSIKFGWETLKKRPLIIIGSFLLAMAISGIISALLDPGDQAPVTAITILMSIVSGLVSIMVELGLTSFSLKAHDGVERVGVKDLWNPKPFLFYLIGQILVGIIVVVGLILLIVPGVIAALMFLFTSYLIVDKGLGPINAMKESMRITKGHRLQLFLLVLSLVAFNILGLLALVVGLLVTIPVSMLAIVHVYRTLEHKSSEMTPVSVL